MLLHEFKYQEKQKKQQLLFDNGVFLASRFIKDYQLVLYAVDSFYVEVYFDLEHQQIGYIKAFSSTDDLMPYLDSIEISSLVKSTSFRSRN